MSPEKRRSWVLLEMLGRCIDQIPADVPEAVKNDDIYTVSNSEYMTAGKDFRTWDALKNDGREAPRAYYALEAVLWHREESGGVRELTMEETYRVFAEASMECWACTVCVNLVEHADWSDDEWTHGFAYKFEDARL